MGQILLTTSYHRDHSILYALVCENELSQMGKNNRNPDMVCEKYCLMAFSSIFENFRWLKKGQSCILLQVEEDGSTTADMFFLIRHRSDL